jgi:acyl-coenzyme A thioesterase PaaI-like protein
MAFKWDASLPAPEMCPSSPRAVQDRYPDAYAHCYGCGRLNPEGIHLRSFEQGDTLVARVRPGEHDISYPEFAFGGFLASVIDCHSIATASLAAHRTRATASHEDMVIPFVTAGLKVDFVRPTPAGTELELRARALFVGSGKVVVSAEVCAGDQVYVRGEVVAVEAPPSMRGHGQTA